MAIKAIKLTVFWTLLTVIMEDVVNGWYWIDWTMIALGVPFTFVTSLLFLLIQGKWKEETTVYIQRGGRDASQHSESRSHVRRSGTHRGYGN